MTSLHSWTGKDLDTVPRRIQQKHRPPEEAVRSVQETGLCDVCIELWTQCLQDSDSYSASFPVHWSAESLAASVKDGCVVCSELWHEYDPDGLILHQPSHPQWEIWKSRDGDEPFSSLDLSEWKNEFSARIESKALNVDHMSRNFHPVNVLRPAKTIDQRQQAQRMVKLHQLSSTGDECAMEIAANWIRECETNHKCAKKNEHDWAPTRLIDVSPTDSPDVFRVILPPDEPPTPSYLALSHCWGDGVDVLKLTRRNFSEMQSGMSKDLLPPTFRDAADVCIRLGVRYLWIDSLCIVQDDPADWRSEAKMMSEVYANSKCNISASANSSAREPLFRHRHQRDATPLQITLPASVAPKCRLVPGSYSMSNDDVFRDFVSSGELSRRAWVFQERLLSPRVLHFTHGQLIWECHERVATEAYPHGHTESMGYLGSDSKGFRNRIPKLHITCSPLSEDEDCKLCIQWSRLVSLFSRGRLTFLNDRPHAILGLAKEIEEISGVRYILGMFVGHVWRQILWSVRVPENASSAPDLEELCDRQIPSFSWLSMDRLISLGHTFGSVSFHDHGGVRLYDVVELRPGAAEESDPDFELKALIEMKCSLMPIYLQPIQRVRFTFEWPLSTSKGGTPLPNVSTYPDFGRPDLPSSSDGREHYFIPMRLGESFGYSSVEGLIVERSQDRPAFFRRIGYLERQDPLNCYSAEYDPVVENWLASRPPDQNIMLV